MLDGIGDGLGSVKSETWAVPRSVVGDGDWARPGSDVAGSVTGLRGDSPGLPQEPSPDGDGLITLGPLTVGRGLDTMKDWGWSLGQA